LADPPATLGAAALSVLAAADPAAKVAAAHAAHAAWCAGQLAPGDLPMPDRPARPDRPRLLPPAQMPARRRAGSPRGRFALLHSLAHIELNAIDLAADMVGRFASCMPPRFAGDWLRIAAEEATHFDLLAGLMAEAGGAYGDLPAHDGLWEAALATAHSLEARLAVVPQVLEARGLDVTPAMIARFEAAGDTRAAAVLARILADEIGHVKAGNRWFRAVVGVSADSARTQFQALVRAHFRGVLKPPFNDSARAKAGLTPDWYLPLGLSDIAQPIATP
jgi:uncharacterized ferritin-like protein (DUF455 family)